MTGLMGIQVPDIRKARRVLAVQPHYDDNDISAGGTLAALAEGGTELYYLTMSDDMVGVIDETWSEEEAARRLREDQVQAGEIIGVIQHFWLDYPDAGEYNYSMSAVISSSISVWCDRTSSSLWTHGCCTRPTPTM